ncbi:MAG: hypothetical protein HC789_09810 [Microcoleus sp. CSU_2_2]|nr:hypothetical protein [Microcoleus sp. SU_5_3]NJS10648.1 hypothetical protein [Microcoleus sp. CSU_2_2]
MSDRLCAAPHNSDGQLKMTPKMQTPKMQKVSASRRISQPKRRDKSHRIVQRVRASIAYIWQSHYSPLGCVKLGCVKLRSSKLRSSLSKIWV